jgi:hypothetical protein
MFYFNFDTEEEKQENIVSRNEGGGSPSKKKISYHSKQVSVDFFKLQMDNGSKNEQLRLGSTAQHAATSKYTPTSAISTNLSFGQAVISRKQAKPTIHKESIDLSSKASKMSS